jgi:hypothetical protein
MPEVHLPHLEDDEEAPAKSARRFRVPKLLLEVALISSGVFLGLAGEQWRENSHKRELAEIALRGLRSELDTNRKAVTAKRDYHVAKKKTLDEFLQADPKRRSGINIELHGIQMVVFEHAAWDLAIANGSLANIDQQLAYSLAHAYSTQQFYAQLSQGLTEAMYNRPPTSPENAEGFFGALDIYYSDIVDYDPQLLTMYADLIPKIDRELNK